MEYWAGRAARGLQCLYRGVTAKQPQKINHNKSENDQRGLEVLWRDRNRRQETHNYCRDWGCFQKESSLLTEKRFKLQNNTEEFQNKTENDSGQGENCNKGNKETQSNHKESKKKKRNRLNTITMNTT